MPRTRPPAPPFPGPRLAAALLLCLAAAAPGQEKPWKDGEVRVEARVEPAKAAPGDPVELVVQARIAPGWHIYAPDLDPDVGIPTSLELPEDSPLQPADGAKLQPDREPETEEMEGVGTLRYFEEEVELRYPLVVPEDAPPGPLEVKATLRYLPCTHTGCLQPSKREVEATVEVTGEGGGEAEVETWPDSKVKWQASFEPARAAPGQPAQMVLVARIAPGWHIYDPRQDPEAGFPTLFDPAEESPLEFDPEATLVADETPTEKTMEFVGTLRYHEKKVTLRYPFRVPDDAQPGASLTQKGTVGFMPCTEMECLSPQRAEVEAGLEVVQAGEAPVAAPPSEPVDRDVQAAQEAQRKGIAAWLLLCAVGALLALATPCVYPMIPITVSYFSKRSGSPRGEVVRHALAYGGGIVFTYTGFGILVQALLGTQGPTWVSTNGWVNLVVGIIFLAFAGSLFGWYEIGLPSSWVDRANTTATRATGYLADLLMGFTFTLAAFTCTVPIVAIILRVGAEGSFAYMLAGMLTYSAVFAAPFVILALSPRALQALPRSGSWLTDVKVILGFVELAAAWKFLSVVDFYFWGGVLLTYPVVMWLWAATFLLAGAYLLRGLVPRWKGALTRPRFLAALLPVAFGVFLAGGATDTWRVWNWIDSLAPARLAAQGEQPWEVSPKTNGLEELALAQAYAREQGQPVLLEFSGFS